METNEPKKANTVKAFLIALTISAALAAVGLELLCAAVIAGAALCWKPHRSLIMLVLSACIVFATGYSDVLQCIPTVCYIFTGFILGNLYKYKVPYRIALLVAAIICIAAVLGTDILTAAVNNIKFAELISERIQIDDMSFISDVGIDIDALIISAEVFSGIMIAGILFMISRAIAITMLVISGRKPENGNPPLRMIAPFRLWMLSENFTYGLVAALIAIIVVYLIELPSANIIAYTLVTLFGIPVCVQGFSFLIYIILRQRKIGAGIGVTILWIALAVFTFPFSLAALGLADQFGRIRYRAVKRAMQNQNMNDKTDEDFKQ